MNVTPPRLAVWLLARRLPVAWCDFVVGDLSEEFVTRARSSPASARRWFWGQTVRCLIAPPADTTRAIESSFRSNGDPLVGTLLNDLRLAVRVLWRAPGFAWSVIAVLALGIAANTAVFSIVNAVLLRPLPYERSDEVVRLFHIPPQNAFPRLTRFPVSPANFYDWKREARSFEAMAIYRVRGFTLLGGGHPETVTAGTVGADFFELIHMAPALGRVFTPEEDTTGRERVVILSHRFWVSRMGAAADAVGRTVILDQQPYTVVGVMPAAFSIAAWGAAANDLWVPLAYSEAQRLVRENHNATVVARLKPGVTLAQANAEMKVISERLEHQYPQENAGWGATVISLHELIVGDVRTTLLTLLAAVALVLLIACANVGNLLFTRALGRRKELAVRTALGAGRGRVVQQLLTESLILSAAGGVIGLALAQGGLQGASSMLRTQVPRADEIALDWRVAMFVAGASIVTAILAGAVPALRASHGQLTEALKEGGRNDAGVGLRPRRVLIAVEVAMSLVLLMAAGVMLRTVSALRNVDAGFSSENVLTMAVRPPQTRYDTPAKKTALYDAAVERIRALPGVQAAASIDDLPTQGGSVQPVVIEGKAELLPREQPTTEVRQLTPGYLQTMGIPLRRGRDVATADNNVLLVSESAARLLWNSDDPIGRRASLPLQSRTVSYEVIGIVGDVIQAELTKGFNPTIYQYTRERNVPGMFLVARTSVPPLTLAKAAVSAIQGIDPEQPVQNVRTMRTILDSTLTSQRFSALLLSVFAGVALALAAVGIYSVLAFIVRGRRRDIGIRTALGASTGDVLRSVIVEGMTPALAGIGIGVVTALGSARLLSTMVWGVSASDPTTLLLVAGAIAAVALIATLGPAYRATRVDPVTALRSN
jgi:predicted permease